MIAHKRIRVVDGKVEEGPRQYSGAYSKAQGWTDIRVITLPAAAIRSAKYVHEKNGTVPSIASKRAGAVLAFNASFVDATGQLLGSTYADGRQIAPDIAGRTEERDHLMYRDVGFDIGHAPSQNGVRWAAQGAPLLVKSGVNVADKQATAENVQADIKQLQPRMAAGIKPDGTLVIVAVDGRGGGDRGLYLSELAAVMLYVGCQAAINLDGGGSATLFTNVQELQAALNIKRNDVLVDTKVCDISAAGVARKVHHAVVLELDVAKLFPPELTAQSPLLIIDPGHGGTDPGASGNGITEKEYTLRISLYQYERFKQLGVPVALTRAVDESLEQGARTRIVRESGAKYCISNHINAGGGDGVETIHSIHARPDLAKALADGVVAAGQKFRRVFSRQGKSGDYYYMHRQTGSVSTVIVEYGFVDNVACAERVKENWQAYAEGVVKAFCASIKHPYTPPAEAEPDAPDPSPDGVTVVINGQRIADGILRDGRAYAPVRAIGDALGMAVGWDAATKTASLNGGK